MGKIIQFPIKNIEEEDTIKEEIDKMYKDFYTDPEWVEEFYNTPYVMENQ